MSMIISEVYEAFVDAGASEGKAKSAASVILPKVEIESRLGGIEKELVKIREAINGIRQNLAVLNYVHGPLAIGLLIRIAFF